MYYSATMLKMAGFEDNQTAIIFSICVALTNMVFTVVGMLLIDRTGRRKLLLVTLPFCAAGLALLGVAFYLILGFWTKQDTCLTYTSCSGCQLDLACGYCTGTSLCLAGNETAPIACSIDEWVHDAACEGGSDAGAWLALCALVFYVAFFAIAMGPVLMHLSELSCASRA